MPERKDLLLEAGLALASELSLPVVLQRIVDLAAQITDARYGALGVIGPGGMISEFITTGISAAERKRLGHIPEGHGIIGLLIKEARPLRLPDLMKDPRAHGFPPGHPPMHTFLGSPVQAMGRVFGNIYLTEKRGGETFTQDDEDDLVVLATQAGVAIANATLYEEARHREQWLDAIREVNGALLAGSAIETTLSLICRLATELADADLALLVLPGEEPDMLRVTAGVGADARRVLGSTVPLQRSLTGQVARSGQPIVLERATKDPRSYAPLLSAAGIGPVMVVPTMSGGRPSGALVVGRREGRPAFPAGALAPVDSFARQASVALDYAEARAAAERVALVDDRERIAKDLHDGIIQSLFAVGMGLQGTAMIADQVIGERIESAVAEIDRVIRDLRNYIFGLRPGLLADRQLDQALRTLVADFQEKAGVQAEVDIDAGAAGELSSKAGDLLQLVREALSNVSRHASATHAVVRLTRAGGRAAMLEVADDGTGFEEARVRPGQGLGNMRERAARIGGRLELRSTPGEGTTLRIEVPY